MSQRLLYILLMIFAGSSYGMVTPLVKLAVAHGVAVSLLTIAQYPLPLVVFTLGMALTARTSRLCGRDLWALGAVGIAVAATSVAYYQSLLRVPAALGIILLFQFAWMVPVLVYVVEHRAPTFGQWVAIGLIWAGTVLAAGTFSFTASPWGIALGFMAGLGYAATLYLSGRLATASSPWQRSSVSNLAAFVTVLIAYHPWPRSLSEITAGLAWGSLIGIFSQALPLLFLFISAPRLGGSLTAILASIELPVAVALSALWLHEPVGVRQWFGVTVILTGIVLGSLMPARVSNLSP